MSSPVIIEDMTSNVPTCFTEEQLLQTITKLLDKAGRDPRLTPRLLREKAEQRLTLTKGDLKPQRERIKTIICDWWQAQKQLQSDKENANFKAVSDTVLNMIHRVHYVLSTVSMLSAAEASKSVW